MGTPDFAVPTLKQLINSSHELVAVYSQPPRPAGRGKKEQKSPIHELAEQYNIQVKTPASLKKPEAQKEFTDMKADVAVVAAYGLLLPEAILKGTKFGCINVHPSLLPRWRGAAPIQRAIMAGDKETGVCIMQMDKGLDTGDVMVMERYSIPARTTAGMLHDMLAKIGAKLVLQTLDKLSRGKLESEKQSTEGITYANKITKEDEKIDWQKTAAEIANQIHGLSPRPGAFFEYKGEKIKIFSAETQVVEHSKPPGTILDNNLVIACGKNVLKPLKLQRPGKNPLDIKDFLRGFSIPAGEVLK